MPVAGRWRFTAGGRVVETLRLPAAPVYDGIAASGGSVFAVLRNGAVVSLGAE